MLEGQTDVQLSGMAVALTSRLPAILREVRDVLIARQLDCAEFLADRLPEIEQTAVPFMTRLVALVGREGQAEVLSALERAAFEEIGRQRSEDGRDVTGLLSAYRIGARVAWQHASSAAVDHGLSTEALAALGGALFSAIDEMSAASLHGYVQHQAATLSTRERRREELAALLLSDRADSAMVRTAAQRAGWRLPARASVIVIEPDNEVARNLLSFDGDVCLRLSRDNALIAILPDPDAPGRRARLEATLRGARAVLGVAVPIDGLPMSLSVAQLAADLRRRRVLTNDPLFAEDHLETLIVHHNARLLSTLRDRCLGALAGLPDSARQRLEETLLSWLHNLGDHRTMAAELHIHPQTVRYRLRRLRACFGAELDDPHFRESLVLAMAWGRPVLEPDS